MTKLEWVFSHGYKLHCEYVKRVIVAAAMSHTKIDDKFIVENFCPSHYGISNTAHCYVTSCEDCWNEEAWDCKGT